MALEFRLVLKDILEAIDAAREACEGVDSTQFNASRMRCFAAQRALEIISEATRHLPRKLSRGMRRNLGRKSVRTEISSGTNIFARTIARFGTLSSMPCQPWK
jgi:F420-dependent methylenetetrahydromethanopterin dehydrogenase